jgi:long-subunit fatty acid transport protein
MTDAFGTYGFGYKRALNEKMDVAIVLENALGANVAYPAGTNYLLQGSTAEIKNTSLTAMLRYKLPENFSVIGGLRVLRTSGTVALPAVGNYHMTSSTETDLGYLVGVAWEKPEIAARVALTYNSKITHDFKAHESFQASSLLPVVTGDTVFSTTIPESVNLEFQTGVAADTLVFGSVRWVHWTQFDITPTLYSSTPTTFPPDSLGQGALVDYTTNTTTFSLGLGRKFNDKWSGAVVLGYEKHQGGQVGNLGPTDGFRSVALAATYQATENIKVTCGVRYVEIGDATTSIASFSDNSGLGAGVRVGISF